jgi:hypothetical protein
MKVLDEEVARIGCDRFRTVLHDHHARHICNHCEARSRPWAAAPVGVHSRDQPDLGRR